MAEELRGKVVYIWEDEGRDVSFEPIVGGERFRVRVPIGWSFSSHPEFGVVLTHVMADVFPVKAEWAMNDARHGNNGFRILDDI